MLIAAYIISVWTLWQLCYMHEINGKRMNRYHELGQYAFGERAELLAFCMHALNSIKSQCTACLCGADPMYTSAGKTAGLWAIIPFQLIVMIGLGRFH